MIKLLLSSLYCKRTNNISVACLSQHIAVYVIMMLLFQLSLFVEINRDELIINRNTQIID